MQPQNNNQRTFRVHAPDQLQIWLRDYLLDVRAANRSESTIDFYKEKLQRFLAFLQTQNVAEPEQITARHLRIFLVELANERSAGGVHAHWRAVRAFVRFLLREDALETNPLDRVRSPRVDQELLEPVTAGTVHALLLTCDKTDIGKRDKAILLMLLDTGLRASEMVGLNIGDVDLNDGSIVVHKTKSRKGRIVFVGRQSRKAIAAYLRTRDDRGVKQPLWLAYHTDGSRPRLKYGGLREIVRRRAKVAGIEAPSLHSFRRGFAITMLRSGADIVSLSRLMGHGSLPVLQRYLKQIKEDLGEVHASHSPADNLV